MPLSLSEQQDLRTIAEKFWSPALTAHWEMNDQLLGVVTDMINKNDFCARAMDFVPRPGAYLSPNDVRKELQRIAKRVQAGGASYVICETFVAWGRKQEADAAGQGLSQ